jgi:hypothetical protein
MIEQLEQLCLAVGVVQPSDARQVTEAVNRRLKELLNAQIVKLYWKDEAEEGVILKPIAYINETNSPDPQRFSFGSQDKGVLQWVFREAQPLWLEDIKAHRQDDSLVNQATKEPIEHDELELSDPPQSDSMLVVPIVERGVVHGLYSAELQSSAQLSVQALALMQRLSRSLAPLLYNADTYEYDIQKTNRAIRHFLDSIQSFVFDRVLLDQNVRTAFVARPYGEQFSAVQERVEGALAAYGVRARHYMAESQQYVVQEIISQIKNSHFCIADLTGSNSNVLAEVGMMMVLHKKLIVLKRRGDELAVPFDLRQYSIWEYELGRDRNELLVWNAAESRMVPFGDSLQRFISKLPMDTGFFLAEEWVPAQAAQ